MENNNSTSTPIFTLTLDYTSEFCTPEAKRAIEKAKSSVTLETDAFARSGNYSAWNIDGMAFTSAKIEKRVDPGHEGEYAFTYSTMKGRRVDDIIKVALLFVAEQMFPSVQENGKWKHFRSDREKWVAGLGFTHREQGTGKRLVWGERFDALREQLESLVAERFDGTEAKLSSKGFVTLDGPAEYLGTTVRYSASKENGKAESIENDTKRLATFIERGWHFSTTKDAAGKPQVTGLNAFYYEQVARLLEKQAAELKAQLEKQQQDEAAKAEEAA